MIYLIVIFGKMVS